MWLCVYVMSLATQFDGTGRDIWDHPRTHRQRAEVFVKNVLTGQGMLDADHILTSVT